jgi:hypothetical protein
VDYQILVEMRHTLGVVEMLDDELVIRYSAAIRAPTDADPDVVVGRVDFDVVRLGLAVERDLNALDACDALDENAYDTAAAVLDASTGELDRDVADQFDWTGGDLMLVHRVEVVPDHRGRRLGLVVLDRLIDTFVDGLVVCRSVLTEDDTRSSDRLRSYFKQLGFEEVAGGHLALSTAHRRPTITLHH